MVIGMAGLFLMRFGTPGMLVSTVLQNGLAGLLIALLLAIMVVGYLHLSGRWRPIPNSA
jgi:hypothetical protein